MADQQLAAIERFLAARATVAEVAQAAERSREMRMDAARALEVTRRQHDALVARSHAQLRASGDLLHQRAPRRAVLVHRSEWFLAKVSALLAVSGVEVVAQLENGADAIGAAVAEQPDLVLVEDTLAIVPGEQVVRAVRGYCPGTLVVAQVAYGDSVAAMLDAGAATVFTRQVPPADVVRDLLELVAV